MTVGTLHTPSNYHVANRIQIAAAISGFNLSIAAPINVDEAPVTFESGNVHLFEPNAIAAFVGNEQLRGGKNDAEVLQWCNWADKVILPASAAWVYPTLGVILSNKQETEKAKEVIREALGKLQKHLTTRTFLVGERLTQADITVACDLLLLFQHVIEPAVRENYFHVERWFKTIVNQPAALAVFGSEILLCEKEAQPDNKKYHDLHPKGDHGCHRGGAGGGHRQYKRSHRKSSGSHANDHHQEKDNKKKAAAPEPAPAQPVAVAVTVAAVAVDDDAGPAKEPKDAFLKLPKGTLDMDEWKRTYSNNDIETVALPWLWENLDYENYSVWYCDYKYNDELKLLFMSANLVGGMFQRLDKMRKHAFGSMCIFGENNNSSISGVWLWRGTGLAFELDSDLQLDYEYYDWKKLDAKNDANRKTIAEYFKQQGDFGGKKFNQGKIYK
jgi:elongation factor 1-gamma